MSKGSNTTRGGSGASGSTSRVTAVDTFQKGVDSLFPSQLKGKHSQAEIIEDTLNRVESYSDEMTNRMVLSGQLGRTKDVDRYRELTREAEKRLEELDRQYKKLTGRSFGYA